MTNVFVGSGECYVVASQTVANRAYLIVWLPPSETFPNGGYRCDCFAGRLSQSCSHIEEIKARRRGQLVAVPAPPARPHLVSLPGRHAQ